jgi:hypothetical protein
VTNQHPITPPPELRCEWQSESPFKVISVEREDYMIDRAAQWAADQELEACCAWLDSYHAIGHSPVVAQLRAARRPKPPSLKKQAYAALDTYIYGNPDHSDKQNTYNIIRRALEQLDD